MGSKNPDEFENLLDEDTPPVDQELIELQKLYNQEGASVDDIERSLIVGDGAEYDFGR